MNSVLTIILVFFFTKLSMVALGSISPSIAFSLLLSKDFAFIDIDIW
jgi:hypothetical protein